MTDAREAEFLAALSLRHAEGVGPRIAAALLRHYGSAHVAVEHAALWASESVAPARVAETFRRRAWEAAVHKEADLTRACGFDTLLWTDDDYPPSLSTIIDPPPFLYLLGDRSLLRNPGVAVVGARRCTGHGRAAARTIAAGLSRAGVTVVSGLAWGIDRQAHLAALEHPGSTMAVLGTGLDTIYPGDNRDIWLEISRRGLLLTEHGPGTKPMRHHFPQRNRIISALSMGVVVVEAPERSGALNTVRHAVEQHREVFAVRGPDPSAEWFAGCRALLDQGAVDVRRAEDVLRELAPVLARLTGMDDDTPDDDTPDTDAADDTEQSPPAEATPPPAADLLAEGSASFPCGKGPGPLDSPEPERAVDDGADAADNTDSAPGDDAAHAVQFLLENGATHVDALCRSLGWDPGRALRTLAELEIRGLATSLPGMRYAAK